MQREGGAEENLRKQDTSKASFMSGGRVRELYTRTLTGSLGGCHAIAALSF